MPTLQNKVVAITGAGQGIGEAAAVLFAKEGAQVVLLEINEKAGRETEQAIIKTGGLAHFIKVDISKPEAVEGVFEEIDKKYGKLHVLYNNASIFLGREDGPVAELAIETWNKILKCNLFGLFHCCKYAIPLLQKNGGGVIINTSSSAAIMGIAGCDAYTATKGATISLTRSLAVEYGRDKIRVNCIIPAGIHTPMIAESNLNDPDFDEEAFLNRTPLRKWGKPEDIANLALFLASDKSSYLNGAAIVADGGITITPFF